MAIFTVTDEHINSDAAAKLFAQFKDMRVIAVWQAGQDEKLNLPTQYNYTIKFQRLGWDHNAHENVWRDQEQGSFEALITNAPEAYRYLVEACPEKVPPLIAELAPDDMNHAIHRYLMWKRKGCPGRRGSDGHPAASRFHFRRCRARHGGRTYSPWRDHRTRLPGRSCGHTNGFEQGGLGE